ncbi:hypothetical protein SAMN05444287_0328 [Octadecabacter temperatus]|jgi:hypothetical protein|uniref:Uncharacterized protein n=1 Tax=Octadecabacter temperatus TaxID=1458307 RepID=A0A0K0Y2W6_9RHOB|nr:DUF1150 family protein [Octadecabacter temperatus]AKS45236.1 hypothetical protein OSB_06750 [Octadecabacter temperatus]SIN88874.1 hypothetical protein SAMN05444287_0328 [Octadecabacter temperatus]
MDTKFNFADMGDRVVYVKSVDVAGLPDDVREAAGDRAKLFAVHDSEGQQLALVAEREMAFVLARQNDMRPVTVH